VQRRLLGQKPGGNRILAGARLFGEQPRLPVIAEQASCQEERRPRRRQVLRFQSARENPESGSVLTPAFFSHHYRLANRVAPNLVLLETPQEDKIARGDRPSRGQSRRAYPRYPVLTGCAITVPPWNESRSPSTRAKSMRNGLFRKTALLSNPAAIPHASKRSRPGTRVLRMLRDTAQSAHSGWSRGAAS